LAESATPTLSAVVKAALTLAISADMRLKVGFQAIL